MANWNLVCLSLLLLCTTSCAGHRHSDPKVGTDSNRMLRIKYWADGGMAGTLTNATQLIRNCLPDRSEYPFTPAYATETSIVKISNPAFDRIMTTLTSRHFWDTRSKTTAKGSDLLHQALQIEIDGRLHRVDWFTRDRSELSYPRNVMEELLGIAKQFPVGVDQ